MEPLFGFILYLAACIIVAIVASKRGRSGWIFFLACIVAAPVFVVVAAKTGTGSFAAGVSVFVVPLVALVVAIASDSAKQLAVEQGEFGDYKKCPFCAESVRKEAIKCKHCGSELPAVPPSPPKVEPPVKPPLTPEEQLEQFNPFRKRW